MIHVIKKGIYTKLNASRGLTSLLSSATAIHHILAPVGAALPYVVYTFAGGGSDNMTQLESEDEMWYIKGVAESASTAGQIAAAIYNALHKQTLSLDEGWTAYRCQHSEPIAMVEVVDRKQYYYMGGSYRIRTSQ